jgi:hypothetical protein
MQAKTRSDFGFAGLLAVEQSKIGILLVADDGVAHVGRVYAELVCAPGNGLHLDERCAPQSLYHAKTSFSRAALVHHPPLRPALGVAPDGGADASLILIDAAGYKGEVSFIYEPAPEVARKLCERAPRFGHDHKAAGRAIEPVNQTGTDQRVELSMRRALFILFVEAPVEVIDKGVGESARLYRYRGMNEHAGRLDDDNDMLIFVGYLNRYRFRHHRGGRALVERYFDLVARRDPLPGTPRRLIYKTRALAYKVGYAHARERAEARGKKLIEPSTSLFIPRAEPEREYGVRACCLR